MNEPGGWIIDTWNVVDAFALMGFAHRRVSGRIHAFYNEDVGVVFETARGLGFEMIYLFKNLNTYGLEETMQAALESLDDIELHPLVPPTSDTSQPRLFTTNS